MASKRKRKQPKSAAQVAMAAWRRESIVSGNMPRAKTIDNSKAKANKAACRGRVQPE